MIIQTERTNGYGKDFTFRETLNECLKNPDFRAEWEALEPERQAAKDWLEETKEPESAAK